VTQLVLKVDIDTKIGLLEGVPALMDIMAGEGNIAASFFVAMGPDNSGRALKRLLRPGFLRKQLKSKAAASYGLGTMLYGLPFPGPVIACQGRSRFKALLAAGHEVGLHGWDHVFWHDYARYLSPEQTREQLTLAARLFQKITGLAPSSFAAPGWQINISAWETMAEMGLTHTSCVRGYAPFMPQVKGKALPLLEIPTTMPSLDEALGLVRRAREAPAWLASYLRPRALNVFTLHGEVEGRVFPNALREFIQRAQNQGTRFITLRQAALEWTARPQERGGGFIWGEVKGRAGQLALQNPCG
jgi:peptidoglycan/xylan/chitin deacetylase (PgdA/CDA1 family)